MTQSRRKQISRRTTAGRLDRPLFLGIDGGGTSTRAAVIDSTGAVLARAESGPGNYIKAGVDVVRCSFADLQSQLSAALGLAARLRGVCAGLAGSGRPADQRILRALLGELFPSQDLCIENDGFVALYGATRGGPGILAIAGTGSIVVGLGPRGERTRAGGWGHLWGDEGSSYDIGRLGVKAVLDAHDGRGPKTSMAASLLQLLKAKTPPEMVTTLYAEHHTPDRIAALARIVFDAATRRDRVADAVLRTSASDLARTVEAVASSLGLQYVKVRVYTSGGAFRSRAYQRIFREAVSNRLPDVVFGKPALPAEVGAALWAQRRAQL